MKTIDELIADAEQLENDIAETEKALPFGKGLKLRQAVTLVNDARQALRIAQESTGYGEGTVRAAFG